MSPSQKVGRANYKLVSSVAVGHSLARIEITRHIWLFAKFIEAYCCVKCEVVFDIFQVNALRKIRSSDDQIPDHHLDEKEEENEVHKSKNGMHFFEVSIHGIRGFTPLESQVTNF